MIWALQGRAGDSCTVVGKTVAVCISLGTIKTVHANAFYSLQEQRKRMARRHQGGSRSAGVAASPGTTGNSLAADIKGAVPVPQSTATPIAKDDDCEFRVVPNQQPSRKKRRIEVVSKHFNVVVETGEANRGRDSHVQSRSALRAREDRTPMQSSQETGQVRMQRGCRGGPDSSP